jgi:hypothetical protein
MATAGLFGRKPPLSRVEAPRVAIDDYVDFGYRATLPKPTAGVNYTVPSWPMYLNDQLGDCTAAAKGHAVQAITRYGRNNEVTVSDNQVEKWYERDGGYVPGDPSTDNGAVIQTVLANWQADPTEVCPITEYAELKDFYHIANVKEALYLFGTVYLGINCPQSAMDQFNYGQPWTYVPGSPIDGGHAIVLQEVAVPGALDMMHVVTWGQLQKANIEFFHHYVEEAWVVLSPDWFSTSGVDVDGFDLAALQADFTQMA